MTVCTWVSARSSGCRLLADVDRYFSNVLDANIIIAPVSKVLTHINTVYRHSRNCSFEYTLPSTCLYYGTSLFKPCAQILERPLIDLALSVVIISLRKSSYIKQISIVAAKVAESSRKVGPRFIQKINDNAKCCGFVVDFLTVRFQCFF